MRRDQRTASHPLTNHHASPITHHSPILTRDFVLTCGAGFMLFSSMLLLLGVLPLYLKEDLAGSDAAVGLILGVFAFAALFPRPFVGREIDRAGSRKFLLAGATIFVTSSLLYVVADSIPLLLGVRMLHGIGMASFHTAAFTFIAQLAPADRRGEAMGIWGLTSTFATAIAPFLGLELRDAAGNQAVFLTSAGCAALALGLLLVVREPVRDEPAAHAAPAGGLFERAVLPPSVISALFTLVYGATQSFVLLYAAERDIGQKGLYFTVFAGAVIASRVFGGRLADRYGRWAIILPAMLVASVAMLTLAVASNLGLLLLAGALFGLAFGAGNPALTALAIDLVPPARRGAGMATFTSSFELGIGSGAIVMGLVAGALGYSGMFAVCALSPLAALAFGLTQRRAHPGPGRTA